MCGISAIIVPQQQSSIGKEMLEKKINGMLKKIHYRGDSENYGEIKIFNNSVLGANRLAIVDRENGVQPKCDKSKTLWVLLNGEIYNHKKLRKRLEKMGHRFQTDSDTEVLVFGFQEWGRRIVNLLDGEYAFVIYNRENNTYFAARDPIGIKPLYYARDSDEAIYFASEQKCILSYCKVIETLPPGHYIDNTGCFKYFDLNDNELDLPEEEIISQFKTLFVRAVKKRLDTDLPVAIMFSGGIDSTAVLHVARKFHNNLTAITIGFPGAEDLQVAKKYCREFNIRHEIYELKKEEVIQIIPDIIYGAEFFESIDVMDTCIGYFGYKLANKLGLKVALCGEGSDELLAGYDLFMRHENPTELMKYRVNNLHRTDVQRVDRSSMLNRVEARVPFLDKDFLKFAYRIPMSMKLRNGTSKWILREAFKNDIPGFYVNRRKARMPDGTGLHHLLYDYAGKQEARISDEITDQLPLSTNQERFFLSKYLEAGFPPPRERFKRVALDYSPHGYFDFVTEARKQ